MGPPRGAALPSNVRPSKSFGEVPWRPWRCVGVASLPHLSSGPPPSLANAPSPNRAFLPVWPSTRLFWPSPRSCARAGVLGKRGYALESVVARICREAGGRVATNVVVRELDLVGVLQLMGGAWKSSLTDCHCMQASSWPLTPLWSVLCAVTAQPGVELVMLTESPWLSPDGERSAGIQSWWDLEPDHVSLFLAWRSAADGLQKRLAGALAEGQIPLRSASDAQASRVVVTPSLGINSLVRCCVSCRSLFAGAHPRVKRS